MTLSRSKKIIGGGFIFALALAAGLTVFAARQDQAPLAPAAKAWVEEPDSCTSIQVGRLASVDGSVITCHTCDGPYRQWVSIVPHQKWADKSTNKIFSGKMHTETPTDLRGIVQTGEIPQVPETYRFLNTAYPSLNEAGLAIGETTIGGRRELVNNEGVFMIEELERIALERCRTAREAIKLMGSLAEQYGYGYQDGGEMLAVSDPKEIWVFEVMPVGALWTPKTGKPGAVWAAERVPDDHVAVCTNESIIGEIDLANPDSFMASPNVIDFAVEAGLYDPKSGRPFSWKKAYSPTEGSAASTGGRRSRTWRFFDLVAPSRHFGPETPDMDFPFSVKPDKKLSVRDVMALTRDKSQGTSFDPVRGLRGGPFQNPNYYKGTRLISVPNVEYTTLTQCRAGLPNIIGGILWVALGAQDTSCYIPFYAGVTDIPKSFSAGDHWVLDRSAARWAFDYVDFHTQVAYNAAVADVQAAQIKWEDGAVARIPEIDQKAGELFRSNPAAAARFLTGYCLDNARSVVEAWWKLGDDLWVKYNHVMLYGVEKRQSGRIPTANPGWWDRAVRAFDAWTEKDGQR